MGNVINTNVKALMASNALNKNSRVQQNVMESLSTGKSINRASDNAAGLSIRETMTAQINGLNAAVKNANDSISMLQTADGALNETSSMLQRMRELAVLSVNDTYSSTQKTAMATEFNQLSSEIDRISTQTQWNGMAILNGSGGLYSGNGSTGQLTFQVGANTTQTISVIIQNVAITSGAKLQELGSNGWTVWCIGCNCCWRNACYRRLGRCPHHLKYAALHHRCHGQPIGTRC
jgi:flagellin